MSRRRLAALSTAAVAALAVLAAGCHSARLLAPAPPLRAASAALYAVDVEFAEPLERGSAQGPAHYSLVPAGAAPPATIASATLVDTLYGRVVRLLIPAWLGDSATDDADYVLSVQGVRDFDGRDLGPRSVAFRTGLSYGAPLRDTFDAHCSSCHSVVQASGNYRTDSYAGLFGNGTDGTPDLVPGNPSCLLVRKCKPGNSMFNAGNLSYLDFELIRNWVEIYGARP